MNSSTDFFKTEELNQAMPILAIIAWKKVRTQTKFRNKKSNSYKLVRDVAESNFTIISQ